MCYQQNLVIKCIFYCLTAVQTFMQKFARIAKILTKVTGGIFLCSLRRPIP